MLPRLGGKLGNSMTQIKIHILSELVAESLVAQKLKHLPGMRETQVRSLGREDPLEKETPLQYSCLENPMEGGGW